VQNLLVVVHLPAQQSRVDHVDDEVL
jgi:hypothetical protein